MLRWVLATLLFFLVVIELVFFAPSSGDRELKNDLQSPEIKKQTEDNEQVLSGGYLVESKNEKKQWELWSKVARKKRGGEDWDLDKVKVRFYGENRVSYVAEGAHGYVAEDQKKLRIEGDVVIRSSNGYVLKTEVIYYNQKTRLIEGPEPVDLKGPDEEGEAGPLYLTGNKFEADMNTNRIKIVGNVKGRKKMSGQRNMKISSHQATFSGQSKLGLFEKNVIIDVNQIRITGPKARFLYANEELHSMFVDGGVHISDVGKWGVAGQAEVFFKEDKYVFKGSPKVVQGEDELVGDIITIYDGGERIQVKKAKAKYRTDTAEGNP